MPGAERLSLEKIGRLAGHARDGSTLPPDRGIRRTPIGLADLPDLFATALADLDSAIRDALALQVGTGLLEHILLTEVRSGQPALAAAYGMTGPELVACFELRAQLESDDRDVPVSSAWREVPGIIHVCVIDGDPATPALPVPDPAAKRVLVLIGERGPSLAYVARHQEDEIPLLFDFQR